MTTQHTHELHSFTARGFIFVSKTVQFSALSSVYIKLLK